MARNEPLWTLEELAAQAACALSSDYPGQANGQVRDVPDARTIRYYTTLGLLERAAEMRARTALYGRRHLLQLVAIKRLQSRGLSLAEIQAQLLGISSQALARLARVPAEVLEASSVKLSVPPASDDAAQAGKSRPSRKTEAFWKAQPAALSETREVLSNSALLSRPSPVKKAPPGLLQGMPLRDDVTLLFRGVLEVTQEDIEAIRTRAAPLLSLLEARGLCRKKEKGDYFHD